MQIQFIFAKHFLTNWRIDLKWNVSKASNCIPSWELIGENKQKIHRLINPFIFNAVKNAKFSVISNNSSTIQALSNLVATHHI